MQTLPDGHNGQQSTPDKQEEFLLMRKGNESRLLDQQYEILANRLSPVELSNVMKDILLSDGGTLFDKARIDFKRAASAEGFDKANGRLPKSREKRNENSSSESKEFRENPNLLALLKIPGDGNMIISTPDGQTREAKTSDIEHKTDIHTEKIENRVGQISLIREVAGMYSEYLSSIKKGIQIGWINDKPQRYQNQIDKIHDELLRMEALSSNSESMMSMDMKSMIDTMFVAETDIGGGLDHMAVKGFIRKDYQRIKEILLGNDSIKFDAKGLRKKKSEIYSLLRKDDKLDDDSRYNTGEPIRKSLERDILTHEGLRKNEEIRSAFDSVKLLTEKHPEKLAELSSLSEKGDKIKLIDFLKKQIPGLKDRSYAAVASDCAESGKEAVRYKNQPRLKEQVKEKLSEQTMILMNNAPTPEKKKEFQSLLKSDKMKQNIEETIRLTSESLIREALTRSITRNCLSEHKDVIKTNIKYPEVDLYTDIEGLQGITNISDRSLNNGADVIQDWVIPIVLMWGVGEVLIGAKAIMQASKWAKGIEAGAKAIGAGDKLAKVAGSGLSFSGMATVDGIIGYETFTAWQNLISAQDAEDLNKGMDDGHETLKSILFMGVISGISELFKKYKVYERLGDKKDLHAGLKYIPLNAIVTIPVHTAVLTGVSLIIKFKIDKESIKQGESFSEVAFKEASHIAKLVIGLYIAGYIQRSSIGRPLVVEAVRGRGGEQEVRVSEEAPANPKKVPQTTKEHASNPLLLPESKYADLPRKRLLELRDRINAYMRKHPKSPVLEEYKERLAFIGKALESKPAPKPVLPKPKKEPAIIEPNKIINEPIKHSEQGSRQNDPLEKANQPPSDRVAINELIKSTLQDTLAGYSKTPVALSKRFKLMGENAGTAQGKEALLKEFDNAMNDEISSYLKNTLKDNPELLGTETQKIEKFKKEMRKKFDKAISEGLKLREAEKQKKEDPDNLLNKKNKLGNDHKILKGMIMEVAKNVNDITAKEFISKLDDNIRTDKEDTILGE